MEHKRATLWIFFKKALRHAWILVSGVLWSLFGSAVRIRDNFLPEHWKEQLQTHRLLSAIPPISWQVWVIGLLVLLFVAIVRSALIQIHESEERYFDAQDELAKLKGVAPSIELSIEEILQRPSFETHAYWNRDVFLRITANLASPQTQDVEYQLAIILRGKTITADWLQDVDQWCRTEIVRNPNPFSSRDDNECYLVDELPTHLEQGIKVDGWLHFRTTAGLSDGKLGECSLRLIARSSNGASHYDMPEGSFPIIPRGWKMIRKEQATEYAMRSSVAPQPPPI
jgi:hypothetical protein